MFQILLKTIKISLASLVAILIANMLGVDNGISAGVIAILSVLDTRAATIRGAVDRIISAFIGLSLGIICFKFIGYNAYAFSVFLMIFVPLSMFINVGIGLVPSSVLVTHLWVAGYIDLELFKNEMVIVTLGCVVAILVNIYFPSGREKINSISNEIDSDIGKIFNLFYRELTSNFRYNKYNDILNDLDSKIDLMDKIAKIEDQNNILSGDKTNIYKVEISKEKRRILKDMTEIFKLIPQEYSGGGEFAEIINEIALKINNKDDMKKISKDIKEVYSIYREKPLPQTREEFEIRAAVFRLLVELEDFINLDNSMAS